MRRPNTLIVMVAAGATIIVGACGSDDADTTAAAQAPTADASVAVTNDGDDRPLLASVDDASVTLPDGWFEMSGYGTVLHVDGDEITPHYVTTSTCVIGNPIDNELAVDHASDDGVITLDLVGPTTDYRLLPLTGMPACGTPATQTVTALDELFTTHYPFFEQRGFDWSAALDDIRSRTETEPDAFDDALTAALIDLGDGHTTLDGLEIDPEIEAFAMPGIHRIEQLEAAVDDELTNTLDRIDGLQTDETGVIGWGSLPTPGGDAVGYLIIGGFGGIDDDAVAARDELTAAMDIAIADLDSRVDRIVVDVRFNGGGFEDLAVLAAGYFVTEPTPAYRKWPHAQPDPHVQVIEVTPQAEHFDGDVVVLTSPLTASAAEVFTLSMTAADATIIGNPSFGEFSDAIDWTLPDGTKLTISMENYTDLDGTNHEATGVPVDEAAPFDQAVDAAIDHHRSNTPSN